VLADKWDRALTPISSPGIYAANFSQRSFLTAKTAFFPMMRAAMSNRTPRTSLPSLAILTAPSQLAMRAPRAGSLAPQVVGPGLSISI